MVSFHSFSESCFSMVGTHSENSEIDMADTSAMFFPATRNCNDSFRRREPPQTEHLR